ncbi:flagellar motor protein [Aurantiacibacter xanthus]|uniref:Flagellar motor protein n=1 Tax=Aurantiacibacter xanthus TaxID=1784712 RepID=A0A3A1NZK1_9SPHN|nr:flagellar motor protein MotB [Aurantiacibacter xanthus]RIV81340.1 flagellar motor protein [Aurantiacibacter xanthus]
MARGKAEEPVRPIIVKKVTVIESGHHGGAWKVAYADFVTAMMAFFLMLWLLGATTEEQRKGIADYFTPTLVNYREKSAGSDGLLGGESLTSVDNYPNRAGQTGTKSLTIPRDATGGPKEGGSATRNTASAMRAQLEEKLAEQRNARRLLKQVRMVDTTEGVRIDLVDDADFSMFSLGTTVLSPDARLLIDALSEVLAGSDGELVVRGHTDSLTFRSDRQVNNWTLSAGRAEATRQALLREGVAQSRFRRIEGVADREPLIASDKTDPRNRRISITVAD